ncbi:type IV pilus modification protein PilV [Undibacterium sp. TJN19]|uniref:type IV pilus modification protein PilV n=1 Tax=Undibacterium sp. TJN19 TaxID=3413055 RepID=UPI003BF40146
MKKNKMASLKQMAGVSMLEVLVAILILSMAALANAGLQIAGMRLNASSKLRSIAIAQVSDMVDRMRSNRGALPTYAATSGIPSDPGCTTAATPCTAEDMAKHDMFEWNTANSQLLPGGVGMVCLDNTANPQSKTYATACSNTGSSYSVKLQWDDTHGNGTATQFFVINFQP